MPKAEVGSTKWLGNKMKAKGLQRLRWYCQVCERQMRDANGFKQHTLSESHVRQMQVVGQNANKYINDYSTQFKNDFLLLLRTSHGEKKISINHFYQEYIANKEHIHMNATKWPTLTEFAKFLGREGICRIEEGDKGLEISWIDNSPEALRRQAAIKKKERQDKGDEEREQMLIQEQIDKAKQEAIEKEDRLDRNNTINQNSVKEIQRVEGDRVSLQMGMKPAEANKQSSSFQINRPERSENPRLATSTATENRNGVAQTATLKDSKEDSSNPEKAPIHFGASARTRNVFAAAAKNVLSSGKPSTRKLPPKPMSEAERIMRDELERKRQREQRTQTVPNKRLRI